MNGMMRIGSAMVLLSIGAAAPLSANHCIRVGPRTGFYSIEQAAYIREGFNYYRIYGNKYTEFIQGLSLGYGYDFDIAALFRIGAEIHNSLDFRFGSYENSDYGSFGRDLFVEPGVSVLFIALLPLTARISAGYSYHYSKYNYTGDNVGSNTPAWLCRRYGVFISPGIFVQNERGYFGPVMVNRFQIGSYYSSNDDFRSDEIDIAARMWDWGFEGGVNRGRLSHTASVIFSKEQFAAPENSDWTVWEKIKPQIIFTYRLGISFRGPRPGH